MFTIHELNFDNSLGDPLFTAVNISEALALARTLTCAITSPGWHGHLAVVQSDSPEVFQLFPWSVPPLDALILTHDLTGTTVPA